MLDLLEKGMDRVGKLGFVVCNTIFLSMIGLMLVQVAARYVFKYPLGWSEELIRFLFVACSFIGGAIATRQREQIEINILGVIIGNNPDPVRREKYAKIVNVIRDSITAIFLLIITLECWKYVVDIYRMKSVSTALLLPMWIPVSTLFLGILFCFIHTIALIILNLNGRGPTGFNFDDTDGGELS